MSHWLRIYDHSKRGAQNHSWTFMAHWCSFMTQRKKSFMTRKIYVSFISHWLKIYDHSKRGAQNHSWTFMTHWCSFMTQRKKSFMTRKIYVSLVENLWPFQARSAKPFMNIYGSLMLIYDPKKKVIHDKKNLWPFLIKEKSHSWQEKFMIIFD